MIRIISFLLICLVIAPVSFADARGEVESDLFKLVKEYWNLKDDYYRIIDNGTEQKIDAYLSHMDGYRAKCEEIAEKIVKSRRQREFIAVYERLDVHHQEALNEVLAIVRDQTPELNFPGYGYPEPGYQYRKGLELSREQLSTFWRNEERFLEINQENEMVMELKFLADFTAGLESGESVRVLEKVNINVDGELKEAVRIKYTIHRTLKVNCVVKFQKTKVWYELHRRKINWLSYGSWELCGSTYVIEEEEAKDENLSSTSPHPSDTDGAVF